jgi:uncharacterized protein YbjT (DUF2867 family)
VLVTGASGGIGGACARAFVAEGAEVVAHYHRGRDRAEALGAASVVGADLTREDEVDRIFDEAGRLDVCAAVAGVWPSDDVPVSELTLERWRDTLDANLTATFLTARGFLRQLEGDGALILVGSTAGIFGEAGHADYAAAKSAILGGLLLSLKNEGRPPLPRGARQRRRAGLDRVADDARARVRRAGCPHLADHGVAQGRATGGHRSAGRRACIAGGLGSCDRAGRHGRRRHGRPRRARHLKKPRRRLVDADQRGRRAGFARTPVQRPP